VLRVDSELGPITLDFTADPDLINQGLQKNEIEYDFGEDYAYADEDSQPEVPIGEQVVRF